MRINTVAKVLATCPSNGQNPYCHSPYFDLKFWISAQGPVLDSQVTPVIVKVAEFPKLTLIHGILLSLLI